MRTKSLAAATAIATRDRKQYGIDTGSWREEVRARAAEHGLDRQAVEQLAAAGRHRLVAGVPDVAVDEPALGDLLAGPAGLTEKQNSFTGRDVLKAFAAAAVQGARTDQVQGQADRFNCRVDLLDTTGEGRTTIELVACEQRLIAAAVGRVGEAAACPTAARSTRRWRPCRGRRPAGRRLPCAP